MKNGKRHLLMAGMFVILIALGTGGTAYFVTGFGKFDLPAAARDMKAARAEAEKAGIWLNPPAASPNAMPESTFLGLIATNLMALPTAAAPTDFTTKREDPRTITLAVVAERRREVADDVAAAAALASVPEVAWEWKPKRPTAFTSMRLANKVLMYDAHLAARQGKADEALKRIDLALHLGRLQAGEGRPTQLLVALANDAVVFHQASWCAGELSDNPDALRRLENLLSKKRWTFTPAHIVRASELMSRIEWEGTAIPAWMLTTDYYEEKPLGNVPVRVPGGMVKDAQLAAQYRKYAKLIPAADKGWEELIAVEQKDSAEALRTGAMSRASDQFAMFSSMHDSFRKRDAQRIVLLAGIRRLIDPTSPLPPDPYRPASKLIFQKAVTGFRLYSVGPDGVDDGGKTLEKPDVGYEFRVRR